MSTTRGDNEGRTQPDDVTRIPAEGLVYVLPAPAISGVSDDKISLRQVWRIIWRGKRTVIAATTIFALGSLAYALLATEIYRAEVLLAPAAQQSTPGIGGQLGGLAALVGCRKRTLAGG
jgi:uncharacterized protein involved in exopolysaccharide biosynthesis